MSTAEPKPPSDLSRRHWLLGSAAVTGTAAAGLVGSSAPSEAGYRTRRYKGKPLLGGGARHLVNRFSYGLTPQLTREVRKQGGASAWFERQLRPASISDGAAAATFGWWPSLAYDHRTLWQRQRDSVEGGWEVMADYQRWLLIRRITTKRQVAEVMTDFWLNYLNVPVSSDAVFAYRVDYDRVIRTRALSSFESLLQAAIIHPAMGLYLDNAFSTKRHPNENLGRELLELHTVGRGTFTEDDVKDSSRILTGYLVDAWRTFDHRYDPAQHYVGPVRVMGFEHANSQADGRGVVQAYLRYLAHHPATAQRVARRLATKFVQDDPPARLVDSLARVYLQNQTQIKPVLRALVRSPEFKRSGGRKVRDPAEDVVATYRALGAKLRRPTSEAHAAHVTLWQTDAIGKKPHDWPTPDGAPVTADAWATPGRMLASLDMHYNASGRWWPTQGITYRTPHQWLPKRKIRFDELVDHLCQQLLGRRSTSRLLKACSQAVKVPPKAQITRSHPLVRWEFPRLLTTILDSPEHFTH